MSRDISQLNKEDYRTLSGLSNQAWLDRETSLVSLAISNLEQTLLRLQQVDPTDSLGLLEAISSIDSEGLDEVAKAGRMANLQLMAILEIDRPAI